MKIFGFLLFSALTACSSDKHFPLGSSHFIPPRPAYILISWIASTGNPTGYKVEVSKDNGGSFQLVTTTTDLSAIVPSLVTGAKYIVRVSAFNPGGSSNFALSTVIIPLTQ